MINQYLQDSEFLQALDASPKKEVFVRIISLDLKNQPQEEITGTVTGGSLNIDGKSALARTCNLTLVANNPALTDYYWALKSRFSLEIGLKNQIDKKYPDIIWFEQGVFVITSFSKNESTSNLTISISGQDKMCFLNGTFGGTIPVEHDFGTEEIIYTDGSVEKKKLDLYTIIQQAVHVYGQESLSNIIINDLEPYGLELWEYRGETPLYLIYQSVNNQNSYGQIIGSTFDGEQEVVLVNEGVLEGMVKIKDIEQYYSINTLDSEYNKNATTINYTSNSLDKNTQANVIKLEYGDVAGYHQTPLTYAGDLILKTGETISSLLDKIVAMLGEYQYFYNTKGQFVFQKKKTYIQELFSPINGDIVEPIMSFSPYSYKFKDKALFTSISYTPAVKDIKNDFVIWGTKKGLGGGNIDIHTRYSINTKPISYTSYQNKKYTIEEYDWRELIYQMALDYQQFNQKEDFFYVLSQNNNYFENGKSGYEQYYTDMLGFWRLLYNPNPSEDDADNFYREGQKKYWNKSIHTNPENLIFWIDFLDVGEAELAKYSVPKIGYRSKIENTQLKTIYASQIPEIIFYTSMEDYEKLKITDAYAPLWVQNEMQDLFSISSKGTSLISKANDLIYQYACCAEGVNITSIPIYYLEPHTRIYVEGIGDLLITSLSYQLNYNGTMSMNCTKVIKNIY